MRRLATALVALLAMAALVTAAGSYEPADQPRLGVNSTTVAPDPPVPRNGTPAPAVSPDTDDGETAAAPDGRHGQQPPSADAGGRGISGLVVAGLVGALLVAAVLAVVLTDDDTRAPPDRDGGPPDDGDPPAPSVDPAYDSPPDSAVVRAWRSLADRVEGADDATTPGEVAARAVSRGVPSGAATAITDEFEAVRYGRASPDSEREQRARRLADRIESGGADGADETSANGQRDEGGERS